MRNFWLVLKHEVITVVNRPSFLISLFGLPLLGIVIFTLAARINKNQSAQSVLTQFLSSPPSVQSEGYVDLSGIIQSIPASVPAGQLIAYPDEAAAKQALTNGEVSAYYIVPADYLEKGKILYYRADFNPLSSGGKSDTFEWVLTVNMLKGNSQLATLTNGPMKLEQVSLATQPQRPENSMLSFYLPYAVTMIFYVIIIGAASLLLSSVAKEKENYILEILMVSVTPQQLLAGKIIGLGLVGLLQTVVWMGIGRALLARSGQAFNLPAAFQLPPSFIVWALVFFLLGYMVYASLMAGLGALVPNMREASQATIVVIFPLIIPLFLISVLIEDPNGITSMVLSIFPLTAPVAMMTRLASGSIPPWQLILAAVLLAITTFFVLRAVARMFRTQVLLAGQPFSTRLYFRALLGKL